MDAGALDVIVIGGGISGLTTASLLAKQGLDVTLLEAGERVGGSIVTHRDGDWLFELGPNTVLENNPHIAPLIDGCGLGPAKITANPEAKRRYLWKNDRLVPLPSGPLGFLKTSLFSMGAKFRVLREPWVRPADADAEETIAAFVRRRLGQEMLDYAVGPFVSGVYAGDPDRLSARWATAKIHALEQEHGSLIRGAMAKRKGPAPGGAMITIREGLEELPRHLAEAIPTVRTGCPARRLSKIEDAGAWRVATDDGEIRARRVVLAVPADQLASLLAEVTHEESRTFAEMAYSPIAIVALGYPRASVAHPLDGFGFLAPRCESLRILGCLFPSTIFSGRAPEGHVALAAFAGGRTDPGVVDLDDAGLLDVVRGDVERALGIQGEPSYVLVRRWTRAIPQYEVGHGRYVELARRLEAEHPGLSIGGNVLGGVSVADCIKNASGLAEGLAADLRGPADTAPAAS
jgi:oxygen-dependent protoporphyrinogen oxidase